MLTFNTPWRSSGWREEMRYSVPGGRGGETDRTGFLIDIFRGWFYESNSCISAHLEKHGNPSWWQPFLVTSRKLHETRKTVWKNRCLVACISPAPKLHICWPSPLPFWSSFSELSEGLFPRLWFSFCPQIKLNSQFSHGANFFLSQHGKGCSWIQDSNR